MAQPIPKAGLAPAVEAIVGGGVGRVSPWQIAPSCTCTQDPEDAVENAAVLLRLATASTLRQSRLDEALLEVGQVDVLELESLFTAARQRYLRTGASSPTAPDDIEGQSRGRGETGRRNGLERS
jgi:hypothetical protein